MMIRKLTLLYSKANQILLITFTFLFFSSTYAYASSYITTSGTNFLLNGKIIYSIGVNRYNLMSESGSANYACGGTFSDTQLTSWFSELHHMGVTTVRFWLFQSFTKNGTDFSRFNLLLSLAKENNITLIPVFENQWGDCTHYGFKDAAWYQTGYLSPYGGYSLSLKDYIGKVVTPYANNPQIMMWEIMNEAQTSNSTTLYNFANNLSTYIKSLDKNHLVSIGAMDYGQFNTQTYINLFSLPSIDVLGYHDYNNESQPLPNDLYNRLKISMTLNKPLFIGEAGIDLNKFTPQSRATYFDNKMNAYFNNYGSNYMIWSYRDVNAQDQSFDFTNNDPLVPVITKYVSAFQSGQPLSTQITPISVQVRIGGLNLNGYCTSLGKSTAKLQNNVWVCSTGDAINMTSVCQWQYPSQNNAYAQDDTPGNPYAWSCYTNKTSPVMTPVIQKSISQSIQSTSNTINQPTPTPTPTPTPILQGPTTMSTKLGGLDIDGYCRSLKFSSAELKNNIWYCKNSTAAITMNNVCIWQYNKNNAYAVESSAGYPYSWYCYLP